MLYDYRYLILCLGLQCTNNVNAQDPEQWQFVLTPVLWNASVDARFSDDNSGGEQPIFPDYSFFSLNNLDNYISLQFEARHGKLSLLFDSLSARYEDQTATTPVSLVIGSDLGFIELSAAYQLLDKHKLDVLAGVRRSFLDIDITLTPGSGRKRSSSWTDPLIGLRYNYSFTDKWQLWLRGDIGGFNVGTEKTVNTIANIQYIINSTISFTAGYRYFQLDFKEDDLLYDVKLKGVYLGLGIHF